MSTEIEQLEARLRGIKAEQLSIGERMKPLHDRLAALYEESQGLQRRRDEAMLAVGPLDWKVMVKELAEGGGGSVVMLRHFETRLREQFDMYPCGYSPETMEATVKLKVERNDESERKNVAGVKFFSGLLTPQADGYVHFQLFEHTLCAGGSITLLVKPDLSELLLITRWSPIERPKAKFSTPEEAVKYVRQNHWYGEDRREPGVERDEEHDD